MSTSGPSTAAAGPDGPRPAPQVLNTDAGKDKNDLAKWWKRFKGEQKSAEPEPQPIFGVPLQTSIRYANVAISLFNDEGQSYIYGYVPIVVAKCGVFLKDKATDVEGIFRLAGSERRIKELQKAFDSPDRYGKGLDWTGFTVHDAANVLRRYFNQLPEPIIPLEFYQKFRDPLRSRNSPAVGTKDPEQHLLEADFDHQAAIRSYQRLITELPPLNRQLLLYILDLLAVFASKSDLNKMTTRNLASIFQPGTLRHPQHDMAVPEYHLSQAVLMFLIENQDSFLIGMQGTAADADTVRDVEAGTPASTPGTPTTPNRSKTVIGRSGSGASVAAESVRQFGSIRRNMSVSSKHSKQSEHGPVPVTPTQKTSSSSVHRSNTAPSRRNGSSSQSPRIPRDKGSDPSTPIPGTPVIHEGPADVAAARQGSLQNTPVAATGPGFPLAPPEVVSASSSEATTPLARMDSNTSSAVARDFQTPKKDTTPLLAPLGGSAEKSAERNASSTLSASSERKFFGILKQSPSSDGEGRKPNKLQKKRIPGSALSSAHSSSHSLHNDEKDGAHLPVSPSFGPSAVSSEAPVEQLGERSTFVGTHATPIPTTPQRNPTDATLRPTVSPPHSFNSHTDDTSDADMVGDDMPAHATDSASREKRRTRWRLSRPANKLETPAAATNPLGTMNSKEQTTSRSTIGSGISQPRRSLQQEPAPFGTAATDSMAGGASQGQALQSSSTDPLFSDSEREKKGLFSRIRDKIQSGKEKDAEKRSRTPERGHDRSKSRQDLSMPSEGMPVRGPSFEVLRPNPSAAPAPAPAPVPASATLAPPSASQAPVSTLASSPASQAPPYAPQVPVTSSVQHNVAGPDARFAESIDGQGIRNANHGALPEDH